MCVCEIRRRVQPVNDTSQTTELSLRSQKLIRCDGGPAVEVSQHALQNWRIGQSLLEARDIPLR